MTSPSPIIWQNADATVVLVDIPHSISDAQGPATNGSSRYLLSAPPLKSPFPSTEPKSSSAKDKVSERECDPKLSLQFQQLLHDALAQIGKDFEGEWCHPRSFVRETTGVGMKRKSDQATESSGAIDEKDLPRSSNEIVSTSESPNLTPLGLSSQDSMIYCIHPKEDSASDDEQQSISNFTPFDGFLSNDGNETTRLTIGNMFQLTQTQTCNFPPKATFFLGNCADPEAFHNAIANQALETNSRSKAFDFILLDPPWPNRSVRRTHKTAGSTYRISPSLSDIRELLTNMNLPALMSDDCLVGIWITNKTSIRALVLDEREGLFAKWDLELVEEWLWLKTSVHGEPVGPVDGVWRKPYEVLLLGRKRRTISSHEKKSNKDASMRDDDREIKRKVIVSVPDLHSRKPCLKSLIEPMMNDSREYRALEVFARNLVAGWWSWGDECVKYNWEGCWREKINDGEGAVQRPKSQDT